MTLCLIWPDGAPVSGFPSQFEPIQLGKGKGKAAWRIRRIFQIPKADIGHRLGALPPPCFNSENFR
jgi:hypothetical protein